MRVVIVWLEECDGRAPRVAGVLVSSRVLVSWRRAVIGRRVVEERARRRGAVVRSARTVVAEKRVAARSCGRVAGEGEDGGRMTVVERGARGRGRGRWSSRVTCEESCEETGSERGASECGRVAVAVEETGRRGRDAWRDGSAVRW